MGQYSPSEVDIMSRPLPKQIEAIKPLPANMTAADYLRWVELTRPNADEYEEVRVIAQSPSSPAGRLLMSNLETFAQKGFNVLAVFTKVHQRRDVERAVGQYDKAFGKGQSASRVRFSNFKRRSEIRELLDIGNAAARLNDPASSLDTLVVRPTTDDPATGFARKLAFDALWKISSPPTTESLEADATVAASG